MCYNNHMSIGDTYGWWTVLSEIREDGRKFILARCRCGKEQKHQRSNLVNGHSTKCRTCSGKERGPREDKRVLGIGLAQKDLYYSYKKSAMVRGISFDLDFERFSILTQEDCFYCGEKPTNLKKVRQEWADDLKYNGLDRLNNDEGYHSTNVVPCCKYCNYMKRELNYNEFFERVARISSRWSPGSAIVLAETAYATVSQEVMDALVRP